MVAEKLTEVLEVGDGVVDPKVLDAEVLEALKPLLDVELLGVPKPLLVELLGRPKLLAQVPQRDEVLLELLKLSAPKLVDDAGAVGARVQLMPEVLVDAKPFEELEDPKPPIPFPVEDPKALGVPLEDPLLLEDPKLSTGGTNLPNPILVKESSLDDPELFVFPKPLDHLELFSLPNPLVDPEPLFDPAPNRMVDAQPFKEPFELLLGPNPVPGHETMGAGTGNPAWLFEPKPEVLKGEVLKGSAPAISTSSSSGSAHEPNVSSSMEST